MQTVVIIPSRYKSTRFEGKPLAPFAGKPMIQWVYETATREASVAGVYVATDDRRIADAVTAFGGQVVMTAEENRSGTDRVAEAAAKLNLAAEDIVVNIQGDQPAFVTEHITAVVQPLREDPDLMMSTLAFKIVDPVEITRPKDCKVTFDTNGYALYFSRAPIPWSRDADTPYDTYKHLGVYAYPKTFLDRFRTLPDGTYEQIEKLEQLRALEYGYRIKVIITPHDSPEVDEPEDVARIEALLQAKQGHKA